MNESAIELQLVCDCRCSVTAVVEVRDEMHTRLTDCKSQKKRQAAVDGTKRRSDKSLIPNLLGADADASLSL